MTTLEMRKGQVTMEAWAGMERFLNLSLGSQVGASGVALIAVLEDNYSRRSGSQNYPKVSTSLPCDSLPFLLKLLYSTLLVRIEGKLNELSTSITELAKAVAVLKA